MLDWPGAVRALGRGLLSGGEAELVDSFVALWIRDDGEAVFGRAWAEGGRLRASFPWGGKEVRESDTRGVRVLTYIGPKADHDHKYKWVRAKEVGQGEEGLGRWVRRRGEAGGPGRVGVLGRVPAGGGGVRGARDPRQGPLEPPPRLDCMPGQSSQNPSFRSIPNQSNVQLNTMPCQEEVHKGDAFDNAFLLVMKKTK